MSPEGTPNVPDFKLPAVVGPALSYASVERSLSRARLVLDQLGDKLARLVQDGLNTAGQQGARLESKISDRLAGQLDEPEKLYESYRDLILNSIAGNLAPAVAAAEDLGITRGRIGGSPNPEAARSMVAPRALPGQTNAGQFVQTGDASRGVSHGALTAQENELGVDPDVQGATITVTGQPAAGAACDPGTVDITAARTAWANYMNSVQTDANVFTCRWITYVGNDCAIHVDDYANLGYAQPPFTIGDNFTSQDNAYGGADAAANAAGVPAVHGPPGATCSGPGAPVPGGPPTPVSPPTGPPTGPPIGSPPPPPPPPPPCCPEISIPPCPTLQLPDCLQIDLCHWDKLCDTLKDCLEAAQPSAAQVDDYLADWPQESVTPDEPANFSDFLGSGAGILLGATTQDDLVANATGHLPDIDLASELQLDPWFVPPEQVG